MRARLEKLCDVLSDPALCFEVPVFQRPYTWNTEKCRALVEDAIKAASEGREHFAGTLLYISAAPNRTFGGNDSRTVYIVDGQQRLVTLSILITELARLSEEALLDSCQMSASTLRACYLKTPKGDDKLVVGEKDTSSYLTLLNGGCFKVAEDKRFFENAAYFRELLNDAETDIALLWRGMRAINCIVVELDDGENVQDIFESLNSKGVQLSLADLVRNHLLAPFSRSEQRRIYLELWEPVEDLFGDDPASLRLSNAIMGWLTIRYRRIRSTGTQKAFLAFKGYFETEFTGTVDDLIGELYSFCNVWAENYRYHAVKAYKSSVNWASLGAKTLVSGRELKPASKEALEFYRAHFGVETRY